MPDNTLTLSDADFQAQTQDGLVLVDFWAPWCGPCRLVGPIIEELAVEYRDRIKVGKLNVDENQVTAMSYRVMSIPTVVLFKDGKPVETIIGAMPKGAYQQKLEKHVTAVVN